MIVVLDASGAAEIAAKTQAGIDFINVLMSADRVMAPELYIAEISNVMRKFGRRDKVSEKIYIEMAHDCIEYIDEYVGTAKLWKEALRLSLQNDHSVYDMLYTVLARRNDAMLLTADEKLLEICGKIGVFCKGLKK